MASVKSILVATDFSETSERALELALDVATRFDSELTLIHVWDFPSYAYMSGVPMPIGFAEKVGEAAQAQMAETINAIKTRHPNVKSVVKMGIVWSEVLRTIEEAKSDLLVLGTHGNRGLKRVILGSVAEKLVRMSPVPVMTVHGADKPA